MAEETAETVHIEDSEKQAAKSSLMKKGRKSIVMMSVSGGGSHFLAEVPYWPPLTLKTYLPAVER